MSKLSGWFGLRNGGNKWKIQLELEQIQKEKARRVRTATGQFANGPNPRITITRVQGLGIVEVVRKQ
jgi:hypothetical protein